MSLSEIERAVLLTLAYSDQFQYPLSVGENQERLTIMTSKKEVEKALHDLAQKGLVVRVGEWFVLSQHSDFARIRQKRQRWSEAKLKEAQTFLNRVQKLKWIKAVVITGAAALNNTPEDDDVDFLFIVQPRRLWLVRLWVTWLAFSSGKRRSWQGEERNSWCFNMWLDTNHLALPLPQRSLYTAYESIQARWMFDRGGVQARFERENAWVKNYLPNIQWLVKNNEGQAQPAQPQINLVTDGINWLAYVSQRLYMWPHMTREKVGLGFAFFHPRQTQRLIERRWRRSLEELL